MLRSGVCTVSSAWTMTGVNACATQDSTISPWKSCQAYGFFSL